MLLKHNCATLELLIMSVVATAIVCLLLHQPLVSDVALATCLYSDMLHSSSAALKS